MAVDSHELVAGLDAFGEQHLDSVTSDTPALQALALFAAMGEAIKLATTAALGDQADTETGKAVTSVAEAGSSELAYLALRLFGVYDSIPDDVFHAAEAAGKALATKFFEGYQSGAALAIPAQEAHSSFVS